VDDYEGAKRRGEVEEEKRRIVLKFEFRFFQKKTVAKELTLATVFFYKKISEP